MGFKVSMDGSTWGTVFNTQEAVDIRTSATSVTRCQRLQDQNTNYKLAEHVIIHGIFNMQ